MLTSHYLVALTSNYLVALTGTYIVGGLTNSHQRLAGVSLSRALSLGAVPLRLPDSLFTERGGVGRGGGKQTDVHIRRIDDVVSLLGAAAGAAHTYTHTERQTEKVDWVGAAHTSAESTRSRSLSRHFGHYPPVAKGGGTEREGWEGGEGMYDGGLGIKGVGLKGKCDDEYLKGVFHSMRPWRGGIEEDDVQRAAEVVATWDPCHTPEMVRQIERGLKCIDIRGGFRAQVVNGSLWVTALQTSYQSRGKTHSWR